MSSPGLTLYSTARAVNKNLCRMTCYSKKQYLVSPTEKCPQVPGRDLYSTCSWERHAWPSRKSLSSWLADLVERVGLLRRWTATLTILPNPLWLPGLFNPTAFLTALKQVSSRSLGLPLDKITVETRVTCMETSEETTAVGSLPQQGALVYGFFIEGARWNRCGQVSPPHAYRGVDVESAGNILIESNLSDLQNRKPSLLFRDSRVVGAFFNILAV